MTALSFQGPLLALDTSGPTARVALFGEGMRVLASDVRRSDRHSDSLLPLIHELLGRAQLSVRGLAGIACGSGPGSFTGLRVGLAVVKGLALAYELPIVLVPSLGALAVDLNEARAPGAAEVRLFPCIDAGKGEIYVQPHRLTAAGPVAETDELRVNPAAFAQENRAGAAVWGGTGVDRHFELLQDLLGSERVRPQFAGPSAMAIATLGWARLARGERDDLNAAVPVYGRPPDITTPKRPPGTPA